MSTARRIPWVVKYRPRKVDEVANQDEAKKLLLPWIEQWLRGSRPAKRAALLYGPAGCGKTSLVEAIAREKGLELVEMNASDFRRREDIDRVAKVAASQTSLFARGKIILLDEVDGISGTADRGALDAILELLEVTRHPVVMTANDPWSPQLRPLRDASLLVRFKRLGLRDTVSVLSRICKAEGVECDPEALRVIATRSEGDLRSAINDLQAIAEAYGRVTKELAQNLVRYRDRQYDPFEVLRKIFMSKYAWQARQAATHSSVDHEMLMEWLNENIPAQLTDPEDRWRAYEALSRASVYMGRIKRTGAWDLLSYVYDMIGPGVAFSMRKTRFKWTKYSFPQRILVMARTKKTREVREALASHLARRLHTSRSTVKSDIIPFLQIIFRHKPEYAARLARGLDLTEAMVKYLAGPVANDVLRHLRSRRH